MMIPFFRIQGGKPTGAQRTALIVLGIVQAILIIAAQVDITRRPAAQIRGSKRIWRMIAGLNFVGPIAYFFFGRRPMPEPFPDLSVEMAATRLADEPVEEPLVHEAEVVGAPHEARVHHARRHHAAPVEPEVEDALPAAMPLEALADIESGAEEAALSPS